MFVAYAHSGIISLHVGYDRAILQSEEMDRDELVLGMLAQTQMDIIEAWSTGEWNSFLHALLLELWALKAVQKSKRHYSLIDFSSFFLYFD